MTKPQIAASKNDPAGAEFFDDAFMDLFKRKGGEELPEWAFSDDKWEEELESIPLFMNNLPDNVDDAAALLGMDDLDDDKEYLDSLNPLERARRNRECAGRHYKARRFARAITTYTQGVDTLLKLVSASPTEGSPQNAEGKAELATLFGNRAAANFEASNYTSCVGDCLRAIAIDRQNERLYGRLARAYLAVKKYERCAEVAQKWIDLIDEGVDLNKKTLATARDVLARAEHALQKQRKLEEERAAAEARRKAHEEHVVLMWGELGVRCFFKRPDAATDANATALAEAEVGQAVYSDKRLRCAAVYPKPNEDVLASVVVMYPEFSQYDVIEAQDVSATLGEALHPMLAVPAPWDKEHAYRMDSVELYVQAYTVLNEPRGYLRVDGWMQKRVYDALCLPDVSLVMGVFEIFVMKKESSFTREFLQNKIAL